MRLLENVSDKAFVLALFNGNLKHLEGDTPFRTMLNRLFDEKAEQTILVVPGQWAHEAVEKKLGREVPCQVRKYEELNYCPSHFLIRDGVSYKGILFDFKAEASDDFPQRMAEDLFRYFLAKIRTE